MQRNISWNTCNFRRKQLCQVVQGFPKRERQRQIFLIQRWEKSVWIFSWFAVVIFCWGWDNWQSCAWDSDSENLAFAFHMWMSVLSLYPYMDQNYGNVLCHYLNFSCQEGVTSPPGFRLLKSYFVWGFGWFSRKYLWFKIWQSTTLEWTSQNFGSAHLHASGCPIKHAWAFTFGLEWLLQRLLIVNKYILALPVLKITTRSAVPTREWMCALCVTKLDSRGEPYQGSCLLPFSIDCKASGGV